MTSNESLFFYITLSDRYPQQQAYQSQDRWLIGFYAD